jgi:hypothetical protein
MTSYPIWATPEQLGEYPEGTSLTINTITLVFGDTGSLPVTPQLLNGALPPGISWSSDHNQIRLTGVLRSVSEDTEYNFTFRLHNGVNIADRTFYLTVQNVQLQSFTWVTPNLLPLEYVFLPQAYEVVVRAQSEPISVITYQALNLASLSQGVQLDSSSGQITLNYAWRSLNAYTQSKDLVITPSGLYACVTSGVSGSSSAPAGTGMFVDTEYAAWQPQRFYSLNSIVHADGGKIYLCVQSGFSDMLGPSGEGTSISDGGVVWSYEDQACVWQRSPSNTTVAQTLNVVAVSGSQQIVRSFSWELISTPYEPLWQTPAGALPDVITEQSYYVPLQAVDPDQLALTWSSMDLPEWLQLNIVGELSGIAPFVNENTTYTFSVTISDGVTSSTRTFSVTVVEFVVEFAWVTQSNLGTHADGVYSRIQLTAVSTRTPSLVTYGVGGGQLPVGLRLNVQTGAVEGFLEFHAQQKTYHWEVSASDGVQDLTQAFEITIVPQQLGHHWQLQVPLLGTDKLNWVVQNNEGVVSTDHLYLPDHTGWGRSPVPAISICAGIQGINAQDLRMVIQNYLHNFVVQLHGYKLLPTAVPDTQVLVVECQDADTVRIWTPSTLFQQGEHVSNTSGVRYRALNTGLSGTQAPQGVSDAISDNQITWRFDSVVNSSTSVSTPLPWYPYHVYTQADTVVHEGTVYEVVTAGTSSGTSSALNGAPLVQDSTVTWQRVDAQVSKNSGNQFWPANLRNMRTQLINQVGWSTQAGSGAIAQVDINFQGGIQQVLITNPGTGYRRVPQVQIVGSGTGAQLQFRLGITHVEVINGGVNWVTQEIVHVDLGNNQVVQLQITSVNSSGTVQTMEVITPGTFDQVRSGHIQIPTRDGRILVVRLDAGVTSCEVIQSGSGYTSGQTQVLFVGREYAPTLQSFVDVSESYVPVAYVQSAWAQTQNVSDLINPFESDVWDVRMMQASLQGVESEGSSRFDSDTCTWDADATRLVDAQPATALTWDQGATEWDMDFTYWDNPEIVWPNYSATVFDDGQTIWDYYRTLFDQPPATVMSAYAKTWAWWFGEPHDPGAK